MEVTVTEVTQYLCIRIQDDFSCDECQPMANLTLTTSLITD